MLAVFFRTLIIYFLLSLSFRFMGKRQIGELELSELVTTLLLSDIATLPIIDPEVPLVSVLIPVLVILTFEIILTYSKNKSRLLKKMLEGHPSFWISNGNLDQEEVMRMRLSINELLAELRLQGVSDISDVEYAILEENGKLSVFLKNEKRALTPEDLKIRPKASGLSHAVILDGEIREDAILHSHYSKDALKKELKQRGLRPEGLLLFSIDDDGGIYYIEKEKKK